MVQITEIDFSDFHPKLKAALTSKKDSTSWHKKKLSELQGVEKQRHIISNHGDLGFQEAYTSAKIHLKKCESQYSKFSKKQKGYKPKSLSFTGE